MNLLDLMAKSLWLVSFGSANVWKEEFMKPVERGLWIHHDSSWFMDGSKHAGKKLDIVFWVSFSVCKRFHLFPRRPKYLLRRRFRHVFRIQIPCPEVFGGLSLKSFYSLMTAATPRIRRSILSYMAAMSSCEGGRKMLQRRRLFPSWYFWSCDSRKEDDGMMNVWNLWRILALIIVYHHLSIWKPTHGIHFWFGHMNMSCMVSPQDWRLPTC